MATKSSGLEEKIERLLVLAEAPVTFETIQNYCDYVEQYGEAALDKRLKKFESKKAAKEALKERKKTAHLRAERKEQGIPV